MLTVSSVCFQRHGLWKDAQDIEEDLARAVVATSIGNTPATTPVSKSLSSSLSFFSSTSSSSFTSHPGELSGVRGRGTGCTFSRAVSALLSVLPGNKNQNEETPSSQTSTTSVRLHIHFLFILQKHFTFLYPIFFSPPELGTRVKIIRH